jgi:hypothetical protein
VAVETVVPNTNFKLEKVDASLSLSLDLSSSHIDNTNTAPVTLMHIEGVHFNLALHGKNSGVSDESDRFGWLRGNNAWEQLRDELRGNKIARERTKRLPPSPFS